MYWWIVEIDIDPRISPIPSIDHPNVLSYLDILRRDLNVGNKVAIIKAWEVGFVAKRWMEDWGVEGTK